MGKLTTRIPSLSALAKAAKVCAALAERKRRDGYDDTANALIRAAKVCEAKAMTSAVLAAHRLGYFKEG